MKQNEPKFAFITGTSSGIGRATAIELLMREWEVIGVSRRGVEFNNNNYFHLNIDLFDIDKFVLELPKILINKISDKKYKRIVLINNAADTGEMLRLQELHPRRLSDLYTLNAVLPVWLTGFFYRNKPKESKLRIIDISSGAARREFPGMAAYCGSKAALLMSGKVFAIENKEDDNLAIMSYEPGTVDTEMQKKARSQPEEKFPSVNFFKSLKGNNALVDPKEIAKEIVDFLEQNESGYSQKRFGVKS